MLSQSIALPITIMIMLTYAMQIAATSVAMEKEEKTLETLLTLPVDGFAILMGKVSSTIIVAGVAAVTVLIGYNYMLGSISTGIVSNVGAGVDLVALVSYPLLRLCAAGRKSVLHVALRFGACRRNVSFQRKRPWCTGAGWLRLPINLPSSYGADLP